jgi:hypothetical protein
MTKTIATLSTLASAVSLATPALAGQSTDIGISGTQASAAQPAAPSVVTHQEKPPCTRADSLFYARVGQGITTAPGGPTGPALGLGYRLELDRVGIDASVNLSVPSVMSSDKRGFEGSVAKLTAQYYFMPEADKSPYLGGGLSWGFRDMSVGADRYSGTGLQAEIVGGYELYRNSCNVRVFIQGSVSLPLYMANLERSASLPPITSVRPAADPPGPPGSRYLPTVGISLGVAWGK